MDISFTYPLFALLFLLLPVLWFWPGGQRRIPHLIIRSSILALLTVGLMKPVFVTDSDDKHFAIILDQSVSLSESQRNEASEIARDLRTQYSREGDVSFIQIGGEEPAIDGESITHLDDNLSPLGDALDKAAQMIPLGEQGSVTLISDGLATDRHWGHAYDHLKTRGIPVNSVKLSDDSDIFISGVEANDVRAGDDAKIYVDVVGNANDFTIMVRDVETDETLAESEQLQSDGRVRQVLSFRVDTPGFKEVEVSLNVDETLDSDLTNNTLRTVLPIQDPVRVLYLGERQVGAKNNLERLLGAGFEMDAPDPNTVDEDFDISPYDVAILDDVPISSLNEDLLNNISQQVQENGMGLIHSGGEAAFGDGGYHDSPITDLFPVEIPGDQDKIDPSVGVAIILDTSGSMAGSRIELAKHIARLAVRRLQPHDRIGIVEFYGNKHWAIPMQPATNKIEVDRAIGRMKAIGGTVLFPAVQEAYYGLQNVNTRFKHIILITDAGVEDANYEAMVRRINRDRITLSTILVGQGGHNQVMADIANWGGGRFYAVGNQFQIIDLIFKQSSTKKAPMYKRGAFQLVASAGTGWWGEIETETIRPLNGYVEVSARDGAEVLLSVEETEHPVVATWLFGLGRVTAMMTEPVGEGTRSWNNWEDYSEFLGRIVRKTAPEVRMFETEVRRQYGETTVIANRVPRVADLHPTLQLYELDSTPHSESPPGFDETAPGLFEADIRSSAKADLFMGIGNNFNDRQWRVVSLASTDQVRENQVDPLKGLDLEALSAQTGGLAVTDDTDSVELSQRVSLGSMAYGIFDFRPWIILLALFMYLADLIYRRWPRAS
ncbi:MAG: VWA domain-containing protein [Gammaproteobacteria bacterium]|nr:VWA domain-containing protein [Gammaproteobacteria bacterium]MYC25030.1 VWA domain-containing protein [Gammaproteobacteria bacterium]